MYTGFTWPLVGGMAAARAMGGTGPGRGALLALIGASVVPVGFVLGRETQRRLTGIGRPAPARETGNEPLPPARGEPLPAVPVAVPAGGHRQVPAPGHRQRRKWEVHR
ncbi:hypothetical protein [Streptomyces alboniger]|uniref:Uncharacterized protein n=1 Tax=Streptomyces alboniger TaxID=132473 RepID=A0A5J6HI61_STRAD|nr:hypothetical protein [Streptomyces alboniger]QEV16857.1 hypothetical protein CP975_04500 [Streptomyces alboniger]